MPTDPYAQPTSVDEVMLVFPAGLGMLLPPLELIPETFKHGRNEWTAFADHWFYRGFPESGLRRRDDVDAELAYRHLKAILGSYEPKHEHKMAAVAWLASRWFAGIVAPEI